MAYTESAKINKKQLVTLVKDGIMPKAVFDWVETWRKTSRSRWITITVSASQSVYFAEDREYTMFYKGLQAQHQCGGEWNGYKSKDLVNTRMQVPEGTSQDQQRFLQTSVDKMFEEKLNKTFSDAILANPRNEQ